MSRAHSRRFSVDQIRRTVARNLDHAPCIEREHLGGAALADALEFIEIEVDLAFIVRDRTVPYNSARSRITFFAGHVRAHVDRSIGGLAGLKLSHLQIRIEF